MPFYAKDWRSPGESWIKTEDGWEKLKVLETNRKRLISDDGVFYRSADDDKENCALDNSPELDKTKGCVPPHCQITLKCTKEVAGFNGLSDALRRLDFRSAVHDHRRFPYTAKLLELLLSQHRITNLSGCAQKSVLNVLEEIAVQAQGSQQNMHVLVKLLTDLRTIVRGDSWWGTPLGSSQLWGKHVRTIDRIGAIASSIRHAEAVPGSNDGDDKPKFEDLPEECVREILFRLADHRDLLSAAEACGVVQKLSAEQRLWKRLCRFHFTPVQISFALREIQKEREKPPLNVTAAPNKNNRSSRTPHPYLNPRRSPVRSHDTDSSKPEELLDNASSADTRGRVSSAFHEHLKRHRENLLSLQSEDQDQSSHQVINANHNRLVSFQDVRNHFDQREMLDNEPRSPRTTNQLPPRRKNNEKDDDISQPAGGNQSNLETDWEDVFHRARRLFGLREDYAEILHLCRNCRCLFWKTYGHPCIVDHQQTDNKSDEPSSCDPEAFYVPVPPQAFLKFFSL
ncbi:F-box only protein 25-like [Daphnia pulicaria]|uniref:F-box only protein 25-like n=1 Tax=Daphnia pulicaria TaxID=35523 RepID=UPI001EEA50FB|nr:F-box only protein 25-like [Daphnia pulicaria]